MREPHHRTEDQHKKDKGDARLAIIVAAAVIAALVAWEILY